jgi:pyruvate-ferredoxin/flavodoxin oxidoreductase
MLTKSKPADAKRLLQEAQQDVNLRWKFYEHLAKRPLADTPSTPTPPAPVAVTPPTGNGNEHNGHSKVEKPLETKPLG